LLAFRASTSEGQKGSYFEIEFLKQGHHWEKDKQRKSVTNIQGDKCSFFE
jgi:hypothetical protein